MEYELEIENKLKNIQKKSKKVGIVIVVTTHKDTKLKLLPNKNVQNFECITIVILNTKQAIEIIKHYDGKIDTFFIDIENKLESCYNLFYKILKYVKKSNVCAIKGNDYTADSTFGIINNIFHTSKKKKILIVGTGNIGSKLGLKLIESGYNVFILNSTKSSTFKTAKAINTLKPKECKEEVIPILKNKIPPNLDSIVGFTRGIPIITEKMLNSVKKGGYVFDGGQGTIDNKAMNYVKKRELKLIKIDSRFGFESNASLMLNSKKLVKEIMGFKKEDGITIVAGGIIGKNGDVIVDNISKPKKILGIADGLGGVIYNFKNYNEKISTITKKYKIK